MHGGRGGRGDGEEDEEHQLEEDLNDVGVVCGVQACLVSEGGGDT